MIQTIPITNWQGPFIDVKQEESIHVLENGGILYLPKLPFLLRDHEKIFLNPNCLDGASKNISFIPSSAQLNGSHLTGEPLKLLTAMIKRFSLSTQHLIEILLPHYKNHLMIGRTSYRPVEIKGRKTSILKDDTRLHVDAFSATPNQGKRILRVFSNINPNGQGRVWHLGEPYEKVLERYFSTLKKPLPFSRRLLSFFKITKTYRSLYDHYMLLLHNKMKTDEHYQRSIEKKPFSFEAGSSWVAMTDVVSHAALEGQFALEQTFYLPVSAMSNPSLSPLKILETKFKRNLV